MPHHHDTPAEANGAPAPSPAPVTRRQLREQEAKAALVAQAPTSSRVTDAAAEKPARVSPRRSPLFPAEPAKKLSRVRRERLQSPIPRAVEPSSVDADVASIRRSTVASIRKRIFSKVATVGAMAGVGLILVSTTVPANAFMHPIDSSAIATSLQSTGASDVTQELTVDAVAAPTVPRDSYTVVSAAQKIQARSGSRVYSYTNNPLGTIQWPFPSGVTVTSGFGPRNVAGCGFCSTYHQGLDFTPGSGTPIQIVADGVISAVIVSNSGLGNHVIIDHVVNGQKVQSVYAHMQYGSITVAEGQAVTVGSIVGKVGSTGASTGAHLHFEIHLDGTPVDPYAWLQANAN